MRVWMDDACVHVCVSVWVGSRVDACVHAQRKVIWF